MLTKEEADFQAWWAANRDKKRKVLRQLYVGLPSAALLIIAIFINFFSGWYKRAGMVMRREQSSLVLVLILAAILITVFMVIFSARHRWDMHEQRYRELENREKNHNRPVSGE